MCTTLIATSVRGPSVVSPLAPNAVTTMPVSIIASSEVARSVRYVAPSPASATCGIIAESSA